MGLGTPCLSMGLDRLNSFNSPGRQTPAGKAGQRLNGFCCNCIPVLQLPEGEELVRFLWAKKNPPTAEAEGGLFTAQGYQAPSQT